MWGFQSGDISYQGHRSCLCLLDYFRFTKFAIRFAHRYFIFFKFGKGPKHRSLAHSLPIWLLTHYESFNWSLSRRCICNWEKTKEFSNVPEWSGIALLDIFRSWQLGRCRYYLLCRSRSSILANCLIDYLRGLLAQPYFANLLILGSFKHDFLHALLLGDCWLDFCVLKF